MGQPDDFLLRGRKKFKLLKEVCLCRKVSLARESLPHLSQGNERRPLQMVAGGSAGRPAKRGVSQGFYVKVDLGAYHGNTLEQGCWDSRQRQQRPWPYISASEIPTAEMIVAMTNVTSSSSIVTFHRMVPTSSVVSIALLTEDDGRWFPVGLKKKFLPSLQVRWALGKANCARQFGCTSRRLLPHRAQIIRARNHDKSVSAV
jgi:hypothetical protein